MSFQIALLPDLLKCVETGRNTRMMQQDKATK